MLRGLNPKTPIAWGGYFAVEPEERRQGIGKRLLRHVNRVAKDEDHATFMLYTDDDPSSEVARIAYQKDGFELWKRFPEYKALVFGKKIHDE